MKGTDRRRPCNDDPVARDVDVLVVGAGQAGLGTAYHLTGDLGLRVLVLDAAPIGRSWLDREVEVFGVRAEVARHLRT
jgi:putative flavoprotein involved in K+ transport